MPIRTSLKKYAANAFGIIGYFFSALGWLWVVTLYFSFVESLTLFVSPSTETQVVQSPPPPTAIGIGLSPSAPQMLLAVVITVIVVVLTAYLLVKMPLTVAKTGQKVVHKATESIVPTVLRIKHQKDTKKNHIKLTARLVACIKIILIVVPVILAFTSQFIDKQMIDFSIAMYASIWLACASLISFTLQYILGRGKAI